MALKLRLQFSMVSSVAMNASSSRILPKFAKVSQVCRTKSEDQAMTQDSLPRLTAKMQK
jgi:hypothetical protein